MIHKSYVRTRYCESDLFGHINNVSYFIYLEQARADFLVDFQNAGDSGDLKFVSASIQCDFRKQAFVNQNLVILTYVSHIGRKSFKLKHQIVDQASEELIAEGEGVLVHFDFQTQNSELMDERMVQKLSKYLG